MTYDIKSVLSAWALMVFKFFHLVVTYVNILKIKFNVHRAKQCILCTKFTRAACDLLPRLPFSRLCITSGFPLAACDAQAGSLSPLGEFAIISGLVKSAKEFASGSREAACDAQAAKEYK